MMLLDTALSGLAALGRATLVPFWIPVLMWTVWVGPFLVFMDRLDVPPLLAYRFRQGLLALLPLGMGATTLDLGPWTWESASEGGFSLTAVLPDAPVSTLSAATASATGMPLLELAWAGLGGLTLCGGLWTAIALVRWSVDLWHLSALRRRLRTTTRPAPLSANLAAQLPSRVTDVRVSSDDPVPMAVGLTSPFIVLPEALTSQPEAFRMALTHEAIHLRRYDDWACAIERVLLALFCWHPLVARLGRRLPLSREQACDAAVLDETHASAGRYARLLAKTAGGLPSKRVPTTALPLFDTSSTLLHRLQTMKTRSTTSHSSSRALRLVPVVACAALLLAITACSDSVAPNSDTSPSSSPVAPQAMEGSEPVHVDQKPRPIGGLASLYEHVTYPKEAAQQGIDGRVFVQFVVTADGAVTDASVARGTHPLLDQAALEAVRSMTFEPGQRDGAAVRTQMTLPITFRLSDETSTE